MVTTIRKCIGRKNYLTTFSKVVTNKMEIEKYHRMNVSYDGISQLLSDLTVGRTGSITLISDSGIIVADIDPARIGEDISKTKIFKEISDPSRNEGFVAINEDGIANIYFDKGRKGSQSFVYAAIDEDEYAVEIQALIRNSIIIAVVISVIVIFFAFFVHNVIKEIITVFEEYFNELKNGTYRKIKKAEKQKGTGINILSKARRYVYPDKHGTEIHRLAASYNDMIDGTAGLVKQVRQEINSVATMSESLFELSQQTSSATSEVTETITGIAEVTGTQVHETERSVSQLQQLSDVVQELTTNVTTMNDQSQKSSSINQQSMIVMNEVNTSWQHEMNQMEILVIT